MPQPDPPLCQVLLFHDNHNQATRIPVEFELPGSKATVSRDRDRLIVEPLHEKGPAAFLDSLEPFDEDFPEIDDPPPAPKDIF